MGLFRSISRLFPHAPSTPETDEGMRLIYGYFLSIFIIIFVFGSFFVACENRRISEKKQRKLELKKAKKLEDERKTANYGIESDS